MRKQVHISIDDFWIGLRGLSDEGVMSVWDVPIMRYLKVLHYWLGLKVTLYVWNETQEWRIENVSKRFAMELEDAYEWLRFGFHGVSDAQPTSVNPLFEQEAMRSKSAIKRFAGAESFASVVRQHYWFYPVEYVTILKNIGVRTILQRPSYNGEQEMEGLRCWRTQIRIEADKHILWKMRCNRETKQPLVIYTHEWAMNRKNKMRFALVVAYCALTGYDFVCE